MWPKSRTKIAACALALTLVGGPAGAVTPTTTSDWSHITVLWGGWNDPYLRISVAEPVYNPGNLCTMPDGYVIDKALPAAQLLQSMLLTAFTANYSVQFSVQDCTLGRPSVVGVNVRRG